ncbi:MAG: hypothetical protein J6D15_03535 [Clostridia bacterium]|nr:hypothetical protein [Clostridia bacterium]
MGNVCRGTAVVLFVINILLAFVMLIKAGFIMFLALLVSGFVSFLSLFSLGTIIENTEYINVSILELRGILRKMSEKKTADTNKGVLYKMPDAASKEPYGKEWICKKCNVENEGTTLFCKSCGEYK